jgi:lipoprotein-releasing system ATP-binding protein
MTEAALVVEHLRKEYASGEERLVVLEDVSLRLAPGETLAVVGPSGSGKSTLLNLIGSLEPPTAGTVRLGDQEVTALAGDELATFRSRQVGFVFQEHHLLPQCTALENVQVPALAAGAVATPGRAQELLERVGLGARLHHRPAQLSGGERQRVALARALLNKPALLLADEPTGNLDQVTGRQVADLLLELAAEQQVMVILVTHDRALAGRLQRQGELQRGTLAVAGA